VTTRAVPQPVLERRSNVSSQPVIPRAGAIALDVLGAVLWLALVVWVARVARTPAEAAPLRDLLLMMGAVYALARVVTVLQSWVVPAALLTVGTATAVWSIGAALSGGSLFGYTNAAAAFHVACVAAGLMAFDRLRTADVRLAGTTRLRGADLRVTAVAGTVACALVPLVTMAVASTLLVLVLPVALVTRDLGWRIRAVVVWSTLAALAVIGCTVAVAATYDGRGTVDWVVASTLSGNRGLLWSEAFDAAAANPAIGVGVGRFSQVSATASADTDLRWAHNAFLQLAAETGFPGVALALALLVWTFGRLLAGGRDIATGVAAAGMSAMVVTASVDYVWHYPGVVLATAALAGCGPVRTGAARHDAGGGDSYVRPRHIDITGDAASGWPSEATGPRDAPWPRSLGGGRRHHP
jgi:O-antigen ligase